MAMKFQMQVKTLPNFGTVSINVGRQRAKTYKKVSFNEAGSFGHRSVQDGHTSAEVVIEVNVNKLEEFILKAIGNSGGVCREAKGALTIRALNKKHEPPADPSAQPVGATP